MAVHFDPNNPVIKLCMKGMLTEESGGQNAIDIFLKAWQMADTDFEKFIAAYYLSKRQSKPTDQLAWLEKSRLHALVLNDVGVNSALPTLYRNMSDCYKTLGDFENAAIFDALSTDPSDVLDPGPFYHGTKADLQIGDLLMPGGISNYQEALVMNHIYFTAHLSGAGLAATLAQGDNKARIYVIEPTGAFENDPNVTDKRFPGNLTRSYRSAYPLKIVGEVMDWQKQSDEETKEWREKVARNQGEIIN